MLSKELPLVAVCVADASTLAWITSRLRGFARVKPTSRLDEIGNLVRPAPGRIEAILLSVSDAGGARTSDALPAIRAAHPEIPIVVCCAADRIPSEARILIAAGAHEVVAPGIDDAAIELRESIAAARAACAGEAVMRCLRPHLPPRLHGFARCALLMPQIITTVDAAANELGVSRRTLSNYCIQAWLPAPAELLGWCRIALVAFHLEHTRRTIEAIAIDLEFASGTSLRNMVRRYVGQRATALRRTDSLDHVIGAFLHRLATWRRPHFRDGSAGFFGPLSPAKNASAVVAGTGAHSAARVGDDPRRPLEACSRISSS